MHDITIFGLKGFENFGRNTIIIFPYIRLYLRATIYEMSQYLTLELWLENVSL
jgi:hypothetical protein